MFVSRPLYLLVFLYQSNFILEIIKRANKAEMETDFEIMRDATSTNNNEDQEGRGGDEREGTKNTNEGCNEGVGDLKDIFDANVGDNLEYQLNNSSPPLRLFLLSFPRLSLFSYFVLTGGSEAAASIEAEMELLLKNSGVVYSHNNAVCLLSPSCYFILPNTICIFIYFYLYLLCL